MQRRCFYIFIVAGILFLNSCAPFGFVYTHTKQPLDTNMSRTPVAGRKAQGDLKHIHFYVHALWDSAAIGDIAQKNGIETVYFTDLETLRFFYIWNQYIVHVYGE